jgi:hypothetical protein
MGYSDQPTLEQQLTGLKRFNAWEKEQESLALPHMTVTESLNQFFELSDMVRGWRPISELDLQFMQEERALWIELINNYRLRTKG